MSGLHYVGADGKIREQDRSRPWRTDGSARPLRLPSNRPAATRTSPPPRTCSASTTGSSGTKAGGSSRTTSGNRESGRAESLSLVELREPEHRLRSLIAQVFERHFEHH